VFYLNESVFNNLIFLIFVCLVKRGGLEMKNLVVLTGAGMSAESGISTFRDAGGLWDQYPVEQVATPEGYAANPKLVIDFYNERRKQLLAVKPNRGHELVSEMEKFFNVTVITQNIDNLHERAGSSHIIHLHGELTKVTSSWQPNNPAYIKELKPEEYEIHLGDLAGDGSQFRPFIVWFGESVPMIETAIEYAETADIFLIIGTSLNVYPAAGLLNYVPARTPPSLRSHVLTDTNGFEMAQACTGIINQFSAESGIHNDSYSFDGERSFGDRSGQYDFPFTRFGRSDCESLLFRREVAVEWIDFR
jgi:NAD-dependent deacetylase